VFVPEDGSQVQTANHQRSGAQVILPQPLFQNVGATNQSVRTDRRVPNTPPGDQSKGNTADSGSARGNLIFAPLFQARQDTGSDNEDHRRGKGRRPVGDALRENLDEPPNRLPDLCVYSVQLSSSKPRAGQVLQARAVIFNQGTRGVEGAKVRFYLGNRSVGEEQVGIPARGKEAVTVKFRATEEGAQPLRVIADPENEIAESNERNNKGVAEFVCQPAMQMAVQPKGNWPEHVDMGKVIKAVPSRFCSYLFGP